MTSYEGTWEPAGVVVDPQYQWVGWLFAPTLTKERINLPVARARKVADLLNEAYQLGRMDQLKFGGR